MSTEKAAESDVFDLEQVDPRSTLVVITDVQKCEAGFTTGECLRRHWESSNIQRVSVEFNQPPKDYSRVRCPDGKLMFIKFTSERFQLLADDDTNAETGEVTHNMSAKKHNAPPKKVEPVKPASSAVSTKKPTSAASREPVDGLSNDSNRSMIRAGLKTCDGFKAVKAFMTKIVSPEQFEDRLEKIFACVKNTPNGPDKWMLNRLKAQLL